MGAWGITIKESTCSLDLLRITAEAWHFSLSTGRAINEKRYVSRFVLPVED